VKLRGTSIVEIFCIVFSHYIPPEHLHFCVFNLSFCQGLWRFEPVKTLICIDISWKFPGYLLDTLGWRTARSALERLSLVQGR